MPKGSKKEQLLAKARDYLPGGVMHHLGILPDEINTVIARGKGSRIWDVEGREYIDYQMGSGPMVLGHAHPEVVKAVQQRAAEGCQFYQMTEPAVELAEIVVNAVPCAQRIKYAGTGTEATYLALRLARAFTGKEKILKMEGGYHGTHDYGVWGSRHKKPSSTPTPRAILWVSPGC